MNDRDSGWFRFLTASKFCYRVIMTDIKIFMAQWMEVLTSAIDLMITLWQFWIPYINVRTQKVLKS